MARRLGILANLGLVGALLLGASRASAAGVPQFLTEQGRLFDKTGVPVTGTIDFVFTIYSDKNGTNDLWTETDTITLDDGYFSTVLGDGTVFGDSLFDGAQLYLGVKVGTDTELRPLQPLVSVPYALMANTAANAVGDITPNTVSVGGAPVIDKTGKWVGAPTGLVGPEGPQGSQGAQGPAGGQGNAGPQGPAGPQGALGPQGLAGPQGKPGSNGSTGPQGPAGPQGKPGTNGGTGPQGPIGPQGNTGANGASGPTGPSGIITILGGGVYGGDTVVTQGAGITPLTAGLPVFYKPATADETALVWQNVRCTVAPGGHALLWGGYRTSAANPWVTVETSGQESAAYQANTGAAPGDLEIPGFFTLKLSTTNAYQFAPDVNLIGGTADIKCFHGTLVMIVQQ